MIPQLTPRKVRYRHKAGCFSLWGGRLFILPHTLVGIGLIVVLIMKMSLGLLGSETDGRIENIETKASKNGNERYKLSYRFFHAGEYYQDHSDVDGPLPEEWTKNSRVPIKYLAILPSHASDIIEPNKRFPNNTLFIVGMALFWNGILSVFVYSIYIFPYRQKQLLRHGHEVAGKLTAMITTQTTRPTERYRAVYSYRVAGVDYQNTVPLDRQQAHTLHEGIIVRVIYDPNKPQRAIAVELSPWEITA